MTDEQLPSVPDDADELSRMLAALSHPHCRHVVAQLSADSAPSTLSELVSALRASDAPASDPVADDSASESLAISLHHVHLPKLADAGLVEYDPSSRTLARGHRLDTRDTELAAEFVAQLDDELSSAEVRLFATPATRATLSVLRDAVDTELSLSSVAAELSAQLGGSRRTHASRLRHSLLPKLAVTGVVDYDESTKTVSLRHHSVLCDDPSSPVHI
ncbi:hypothetical protein AUR64_10110 [Haloprofundus marisrubri]|uniref:DUF7344 domain-containing protein n=1 Tax=Haloprofundus marisrubri TaxID=1514971 RepID=A0A0W1R939_9EURY|nr:hypothetical protein [Haloprofundus marisrubri]KTG09960.1 hypothetical protein AUR64_10110 [Haloprofundus marisrubri]